MIMKGLNYCFGRIAQGHLSNLNQRNAGTSLQILVKFQTKRPQTKVTQTLVGRLLCKIAQN